MPPRIVATNLARPSGFAGWLIAREMNRRNAAMNAFALAALELQPGDRVLEIGFGGGPNLKPLIARSGKVVGVDLSRDMVAAARRRHRGAVAAGRARFDEGRVESLPLEDAAIDKAITVNTIYFWRSLAEGFAEIGRVMRPGGRVVVGFLPAEHMAKMNMPADIFTVRTPEAVIEALTAAGFRDAQIRRPDPDTAWAAATAVRG